jgi:hypothetical protein
MSRYSHNTTSYSWSWGFDEPLNEFFFQKFDNFPQDENEDVIFSVSNRFTTKEHPDFPDKRDWSNLELVKLMEMEMVMSEDDFIPAEHLGLIRSDKPF